MNNNYSATGTDVLVIASINFIQFFIAGYMCLSYLDPLICEQSCSVSTKVNNLSVMIIVQSAADVGRTFSMNCIVAGINDSDSPLITYQWYKDKQSLQGATAATLYFSALTFSDIGSYVCEVSIKSYSQGHGIIRSSSPYRLNISSE